MIDGLYIYEDFYNNVDEVREYALGLDFKVSGNYPGTRTEPAEKSHSDYLKSFFEEHIVKKEITYWNNDEYNTAFQYTTKNDETWIHHDQTTWAGVLYLTPDAPIESGTSLYQHKETGIYLWDHVTDSESDLNPLEECNDLDKWDEIAFVGNKYNRLVVYRGAYYHRSKLPGFGVDKHTGRLFQTFFFDTQED